MQGDDPSLTLQHVSGDGFQAEADGPPVQWVEARGSLGEGGRASLGPGQTVLTGAPRLPRYNYSKLRSVSRGLVRDETALLHPRPTAIGVIAQLVFSQPRCGCYVPLTSGSIGNSAFDRLPCLEVRLGEVGAVLVTFRGLLCWRLLLRW